VRGRIDTAPRFRSGIQEGFALRRHVRATQIHAEEQLYKNNFSGPSIAPRCYPVSSLPPSGVAPTTTVSTVNGIARGGYVLCGHRPSRDGIHESVSLGVNRGSSHHSAKICGEFRHGAIVGLPSVSPLHPASFETDASKRAARPNSSMRAALLMGCFLRERAFFPEPKNRQCSLTFRNKRAPPSMRHSRVLKAVSAKI